MNDVLNVFGEKITILISSKETNERFCKCLVKTPVGYEAPSHKHIDSYDSVYVIQGKFRFTINGKSQILNAGESICIPLGIPHNYKNIGSKEGNTICVHSPGGMDIFFETIGLEHLKPQNDLARIEQLAKQFKIQLVK